MRMCVLVCAELNRLITLANIKWLKICIPNKTKKNRF